MLAGLTRRRWVQRAFAGEAQEFSQSLTGMQVAQDWWCTGNGQGIGLYGTAPHVVTHNLVSGNGCGIGAIGGGFQFTHNVVTANNSFGFSFLDKLEILKARTA